MSAYQENITVTVRELQRLLPRTRTWAMHTNPLPHLYGDIDIHGKPMHKIRSPARFVQHTNSWVRQLSQKLDIGLADWDHMLHSGWARNQVLHDDVHPMLAFNYAAANIYLSMLAESPLPCD